jgi:hypothetical protein
MARFRESVPNVAAARQKASCSSTSDDIRRQAVELQAAGDQLRKCASDRNSNWRLGPGRSFFPYLNLAAAHALKGEIDAARPPLAEARRLNSKLSVKWINEHKPVLQPSINALRSAGLPED